MFPRVLTISNECLSSVSSNGRTLRNFLLGWPKDKLAQFFLRNVAPDFDVCDKYYYVSDSAALHSFLKGRAASGTLPTEAPSANSPKSSKKSRNAITMMVRNTVWNSMRWAGNDFYKWVDEFSPELILLQAGDCAFMFRLARKLAKKYSIPLVMYNSEGYYFKRFDYFRAKGVAKLAYPLFYHNFCREFEKTIKRTTKTVYICDKLKNDYDAKFSLPSEVVYTATQMTPSANERASGELKISYLGNLGVGRHEGLVEIANALQSISKDYKLDVYGKIPNDEVQTAFEACTGIRYMGFVSYDEVVDIMQKSDILVHTENFSDFYREDLKYAFSTKLADSLASGNCFLLYAPEEMACAEYLSKNEVAFVVSRKEELVPTLSEICKKTEARTRYVDNALRFVRQNHQAAKNAARFQEILRESAQK